MTLTPPPRPAQEPKRDDGDGDRKGSNDISVLYFSFLLDFLGQLAYEVAADVYVRPQAWNDAGAIVRVLAQLRAKYGTIPELPSTEQRAPVFAALFGSDFTNLSQQVMEAASAFAEHAVDTGRAALRESFRSAVANFKDYLSALEGDAARRFTADLSEFNEVAYGVFRDRKVGSVYCLPKPVSERFPFKSDANGNELVAAISKAVGSRAYSAAEVMNRQRAASTGKDAIEALLAFDPENADGDAIDALAGKVYAWLVAVRTLDEQAATAASRAVTPAPAAAASPTAPRLAIAPYGRR